MPFSQANRYTTLASSLVNYMLMFVLGHEYGHIFSGHLSPQKATLCLVGGVQVENQRHSYAEELLADQLGEALVQCHLASIGMQNNEAAIVSSFSSPPWTSFSAYWPSSIPDTKKNRPCSSHPPPNSRRSKLQAAQVGRLVDEKRVATATTLRTAKICLRSFSNPSGCATWTMSAVRSHNALPCTIGQRSTAIPAA